MSRPRVFISSTYFDFKTIREDLDRFVESMGYEAIRHELGHIAYGREEKPEEYAYREIEYCDILVSVIGGRFGTGASESQYSITQEELRKAYDMGKQVYIFVDRAVHHEFDFYKLNKDNLSTVYSIDKRIHSFLEEVYALPRGNPIFHFNTGGEIITILREQWAGIFQRLLVQETNRMQTTVTQELQRSLQTVDTLVKYLSDVKNQGDQTIHEIIFNNHPIFQELKEKLNNGYRVYFTSKPELDAWLKAKGFSDIPEFLEDDDKFFEWSSDIKLKSGPLVRALFVSKSLFDQEGNLKAISPGRWDASWVKLETRDKKEDSDDIPF
jgi:hypothetical protein